MQAAWVTRNRTRALRGIFINALRFFERQRPATRANRRNQISDSFDLSRARTRRACDEPSDAPQSGAHKIITIEAEGQGGRTEGRLTRKEMVPEVGIEPTRGVNPTGF